MNTNGEFGRKRNSPPEKSSCPASSATPPTSSSIRKQSPTVWCATPKSSVVKMSWPAPTAASARASATRKSPGRNSKQWPKARASRARSCGGGNVCYRRIEDEDGESRFLIFHFRSSVFSVCLDKCGCPGRFRRDRFHDGDSKLWLFRL